ncbi:MAG: hypothetical protein KZY61_00095 [Clostridiaceae bacterium]|nr:hypothetical protein [Clostridiaceae bacterium]MBW4859970.1 hypothetical protein [Clostridiaceae bacterium]MBW4867060.1 hypothetical protein [Clostridiaceae bacterium]
MKKVAYFLLSIFLFMILIYVYIMDVKTRVDIVGTNEAFEVDTNTKFFVPIIKTNEKDKVKVAKILFSKYIEYTFKNMDMQEGAINPLKDYKIEKVEFIQDLEDKSFETFITYDLQAKDGYIDYCTVGNGIENKNNWVKGNRIIINIRQLDKDKYTICHMSSRVR